MSAYPHRAPSPRSTVRASRAAFYGHTYYSDELVCDDDTGDGSVADAAVRWYLEGRRWAALARALRSEARRTGAPLGRGYRLAVSRAGVCARRARLA